MEPPAWCRDVDGATVLTVRVVPGASRSEVVGAVDAALRVRVCSPPVDGRANEEVCTVLAAWLGVRPRQVGVLSGATSRTKLVRVDLPVDALLQRVER